VIPQLQFDGVGVQVPLALEIRLVVSADIVVDQGHRHHQGHQTPVIKVDNLPQFLLFIGAQIPLEIAHEVIEHVGVLFGGGLFTDNAVDLRIGPGYNLA